MIIETQSRSSSVPMAPVAPAAPNFALSLPRLPGSPILLVLSVAYLLILLGVWVALHQYGDREWWATIMLVGPRWPLALPLLVLWPWLLVRRRWGTGAITGAGTLFLLLTLYGFRVSWPFAPEVRGDLRVITFNIHRQHLDALAFREYIAKVEPDVIALQGWSDVNEDTLFSGTSWNLHREGELLLASRLPISKVTPMDFQDTAVTLGERGSAACFELTTDRGPINLISMHLGSPHAGLLTFTHDGGDKLADNIVRRWRESEMVRAMADGVQGPLLLMGDFNTTDDSPIFREHWGEFADAFSERGFGLGYTYMVWHTQIRIDHVLANPAWEVVGFSIGPEVGSPHRPLVADVNYR